MNCGNVFWLTRPASTSTNAMVEPLSASGRAANTASMAPGPTSFSRATAFCVAAPVGPPPPTPPPAFCVAAPVESFEDRISVTSRSARKFVKKLIQPFRRGQLLHVQRVLATRAKDPRQTRIYPVPAPRCGGRGSTRRAPDAPDRADYATALTAATVPAPYASHPGFVGLRHD